MAGFFNDKTARKLLCVRGGSKGGAMFLFAREKYLGAQGKNREPGLQENPVRDFTGRQPPPGVFLPNLRHFVN